LKIFMRIVDRDGHFFFNPFLLDMFRFDIIC
jgi:hypothetical protein